MKTVLAIIIGAFTLLGLAVSAVYLLTWGGAPESSFATYEELAVSGLMNRGWLPDYLPKSVSNISVQHDMDSNRVWATFEYDRNDIAVFRETCKVLVESSRGTKFVCPPFEQVVTIVILKPDGTATLESDPHEV